MIETTSIRTPLAGGHPGNVVSHFNLLDGAPHGGTSFGRGFQVIWQQGPLVTPDGGRIAPTGAFVEDVIRVAVHRLQHYQDTRFECAENAAALAHLLEALEALESRTARRTLAGTEGTLEGA